jgi:hypothetical protein
VAKQIMRYVTDGQRNAASPSTPPGRLPLPF